MFSLLVLCGFCALGGARLQQVALPVYVPASEEAIANKFFRSPSEESDEIVRKDRETTGDAFYKSARVGEDSNRWVRNATVNATSNVSDVLWTSLLKRLLRNSHETTTYRYPTATWTARHHEKLKESHRNRVKKMPKIFLMKPSPLTKSRPAERPQTPETTKAVSKRGKTKWKDSRRKGGQESARRDAGKDEVDKFLEQSLLRYLVSSNLIENIGNVSVETFSEVLKNVTREKADKRQFWPYDENKELRIKFRDEVFMRRKPENPPRGRFLEKQLQRRLEKMQEYINSKGKGEKVRNSGRAAAEVATAAATKTTTATTPAATTEAAAAATAATLTTIGLTSSSASERVTELTAIESVTEIANSTEASEEASAKKFTGKTDLEELKLSVAETVYYKKRPFPLNNLSVEDEETGVIPGIPQVDYPMYSSPPSTGFKCPKGIGEKPRMMADAQTRCQVFYVCTGDGPAAAMLCPNGTMFNENVLVCDWWYNVDC